MHRFLKDCLWGLATGNLLALLSPCWLGAALRILSPVFGVSFKNYHRDAYSRFTLEKVTWKNESVTVSVESLRMETPLVLLYKHVCSEPAPIRIGKWQVSVHGDKEPNGTLAQTSSPHGAEHTSAQSRQPPSSGGKVMQENTTLPGSPADDSFGFLSLLDILCSVEEGLSKYLPQTTTSSGIVRLPDGSRIMLESLRWEKDVLSARLLHYAGVAADVDIQCSLPEQLWTLRLKN